ncbi:uncharacterized protein DNG_01095 [Cephalotrichum gorgonifer]|uniref:Glycosyltransferase 2-like domain-containing protein n=1 Tax=Cephalotrichum gorgonifer TaxID=2041049 RepID=A0AAE8MQT0_9PEZI|nr:uncharacterized protein DNG_01095 [Cephalotrichum gorgonifer]
MSVFAWATRRSGGLAMIALLALCYWVISKEAVTPKHPYEFQDQQNVKPDPKTSTMGGAGSWTVLFAYYCLLIHFLVFVFPLRACWSIIDLTKSLTKVRSKTLRELRLTGQRRGSSTSLSSSETLGSISSQGTSASSSEAGDLEAELYDGEATNVIHAIIVPNYKEETDTLRETLDVLASHPDASVSYDVYLGMEQREAGGEAKAQRLIDEFSAKFRSISYTVHPSDIPGESAGKGSNVAWAARKLSERYPIEKRRNVVVTGIDADSHLSSNYFALINSMHNAYPETATTTLYSAPIIFDRNAHNVPAIVRVADILWCAAGLSGLYSGSTVAPPTSVYSLTLELIDRVGGWDCGSEAIGEDLHMYLKCFFALNGNLTSRTVLSPVSQSNVTGGGKDGVVGIYMDMTARYKQALRHMWGALDTGFALRQLVVCLRERKHTTRVFRPLHRSIGDASDSYIPEKDLEADAEGGIFSDVTQHTLDSIHWERLIYLFHRLFEAHFLPVQMTILVFASTIYSFLTKDHPDIHNLNWIFSVCNILRAVGFMEVVVYLALYEGFHRICVKAREQEMTEAGLAEGMRFSHRSLKKNVVDYIMAPLVAPLYGSIPCAQAQICHFWTLDLVYAVSKKVTRRRAMSLVSDKV